MNQPMSILMKDFLADQVEKNAIWLFDKKALAPMWENSINLAEVVGDLQSRSVYDGLPDAGRLQ